ncbi:MAG TPA: hypothetical protein ENJ95_03070 [Bacteroidetes bacterium]|nr:hypothetical protein [Bacteroidota bacterium]
MWDNDNEWFVKLIYFLDEHSDKTCFASANLFAELCLWFVEKNQVAYILTINCRYIFSPFNTFTMSFAGHAYSAMKTIKANRALLKKKSYYKDKIFEPKWGASGKIKMIAPSENEIRKNRAQTELYIENEKQKSRVAMVKAVLLTGLIFALLYWFFVK